ncbi:MAG: helix-turn-helix domain-containing protein [Pseudomonadota bacterium]
MTDPQGKQVPTKSEPALGGEVLTTADVAALSGHTPETIREYRSQRNRHRGPPFHRNGKTVHYVRSEVLQWIETKLASRRGLLK